MMVCLLQIAVLTCFAATIQAKIFGRCELAHMLKMNGLDGYEGYSLPNWICMSFFETGFDTEAVDGREDGTKDYGIFHINNGWWCKDEGTLSENLCTITCTDLLDADIHDDILCAKRIVKDPQGMRSWREWKKHCENRDLHEWVKGCTL